MIRAVAAMSAAVLAGMGGAAGGGLRVNMSPSMPIGLWQVLPATEIARGVVVTACPPSDQAHRYLASGACPDGLEPVVKPVAAVAGDIVTVGTEGVAVNGAPIANTAQLDRDSAGRLLQAVPAGRYRVAPGTVWLLSSFNQRSWDSRYFGPVPISAIRSAARPLWVLR